MNKTSSLLGGTLLIAGTCIGGGMLALPVLTSVTGFFPSLCIYFLCWLLMAATGLLFLEISQWMHQEANIVSMAGRTLGYAGRIFTWILYLFLFYSLNIAYIVESGKIVSNFMHGTIPHWMGPVIFLLAFSPCILIPTVLAGRINIVLMLGLVASYLAFVILGVRYINPELLTFADWSMSLKALPIAFTSFAYQGIIPTLVTYFHHDISKARKAILMGSFIPFIAYAVWQGLIMGVIPIEGANGLKEARLHDLNAVQPMRHFVNNVYVYSVGEFFAFFALVTSFLGVSLGLRDFLSDGLNIKQSANGKMVLALLIFIPPLLIALLYPDIFLITLEYAGGIGCAFLLGLLPIIMVWRGRYHLHLEDKQHLFGGKWVLSLLGVFVLFVIIQELVKIQSKLFN